MIQTDIDLLQELITRINGLFNLAPIIEHISTNIDSQTLTQLDIDSVVAPQFPNYNLVLTAGDPFFRLDLIKKA